MKTTFYVIAVILATLVLINGCKNDEPIPEDIKLYAWACGNDDYTGYGMILFSADTGTTWERQGLSSPALLGVSVADIWAVDEKKVWAVGSNNSILRTLDGGITWQKLQSPINDSLVEFMAISIIDKTNIWISGSNGVVINSINNGESWQLFDTTFFHNGRMQGVWAINSEEIYVTGGSGDSHERGFTGYTLNGGITWDSVTPADNYNKNGWIGVVGNGNTRVIYGGKAHYMASYNGGNTWNNDSVPDTGGTGGADVNHLIMLTPDTWWGALDEGYISITHDGGSTWTNQTTNQGGFYLLGIDAWDNNIAMVVGGSDSMPIEGVLLITKDAGNTWNTMGWNTNCWLNHVTFIKK